MIRSIQAIDHAAAWLASRATTIGQLALVCLGVHLAADQLDDLVLQTMLLVHSLLDPAVTGFLAWMDKVAFSRRLLLAWSDLSLDVPARWMALLVELGADIVLAGAILFTDLRVRPRWYQWKRLRTVESVMVPLTLAGAALAGTWSLFMALQDLLPSGPIATAAAVAGAGAALLRFGIPAWLRGVAHLEPGPWTRGLGPAVLLAPVALLTWTHGVPIWGWLP